MQTLRCVPLGSDVGCASGKNIDCACRKARVRFACCAREWLCSLPGRSWCCCLTVLPAPPALLPLLPSALLRRRRCVGGRRGGRVHLLHRQECPGCQPEDFARNGCSCMRHVEHDDRSDRLDLRARDADGGSYRRRVAERLPRSTSLALGSRLNEEELHLVPAGRRGAARLN